MNIWMTYYAELFQVLAPCLKDRISSEQGADIRDRDRAAVACAVMATLCIRDAEQAQLAAEAPAAASSQSAGGATPAGPDASGADAGAGSDGPNGSETKVSGMKAEAEGQEAGRAKAVPQGADRPVVLERRVLVQVVRVLQAAVDSVTYGGVKFSLESALHALPAAVTSAAHVAILCDLGMVELLVAIVKQFTTAAAAEKSSVGGPVGGAAAAAASDSHGASRGASLRALALSVRIVRCMCSSQLGEGTQGLCIQRLNIVGALPVMTALQGHLASKSADPQSDAITAQPTSPTGSAAAFSFTSLAQEHIFESDVLHDVNAVLQLLSKTQPLTSP
jgi:dihydroxyacetone kinase DhaKLM complex PTS-EIIA-like component DhaM